jgi:hypothetical protein
MDMITRWAHGELGDTKCPMPGMLMMVALDNLTAAAFAPASDVSASKLPEMRSVGMALATGSRMGLRGGGYLPDITAILVEIPQPPTPSRVTEIG